MYLSGREPEGPLAGGVLEQDGHHPLHGAEDGAVDDHGAGELSLLLTGHEVQLEADRELEVQLDGGALVLPPEGVLDLDVDLGAVEGTWQYIQVVARRVDWERVSFDGTEASSSSSTTTYRRRG